MPDPDVVFAATGNDTRRPPTNGIYRSDDAGASWRRVHTFGQVAGTVGSLAGAPDNDRLMFAGGQFAVGVSTDGGLTWTDRRPWASPAGFEVWYVVSGPLTGDGLRQVYAVGSRVWHSVIHPLRLNEGLRRTWTAIVPGNFGEAVLVMTAHPSAVDTGDGSQVGSHHRPTQDYTERP